MTTITKEFLAKIMRNNGVYDTAKYRYWYVDNDTVQRTEITKLDTNAMLSAGAWELVRVR